VFLAIEDIGPGDLLVLGTHQGQLDLGLYVLDVNGATTGQATEQRPHHLVGQFGRGFVNAPAGRRRVAFHGQEGLGDGDVDLGGVEAGDFAVAADDPDFTGRDGADFGGRDGFIEDHRGGGRGAYSGFCFHAIPHLAGV